MEGWTDSGINITGTSFSFVLHMICCGFESWLGTVA